MKTILHLTSSARGEQSYSTNLGLAIIKRLEEQEQEITVETWDLVQHPPPLYTPEMIQSFYIAPDQPAYDSIPTLAYANRVVDKIKQTDILVISTPTYNFTVSAHLKAWLDQLVRVGVTYTYDEEGNRVGLITQKKVYLAIASGGIQPTGIVPDYLADYLKAVLKIYVGITAVVTYRIEGTAFPNFTPDYTALVENFQ
ncbi:FMN-dependent NADH-azoreductase [Myroides odoratus]|uniref:FMN-dependent NADH-azoreductase n=1 Tax=Myroides odoratus TaxID=256 RepID=UPI000765BE77|nr:NAD(P)H-dependent oxidoreductase [Myroides odoratus]